MTIIEKINECLNNKDVIFLLTKINNNIKLALRLNEVEVIRKRLTK